MGEYTQHRAMDLDEYKILGTDDMLRVVAAELAQTARLAEIQVLREVADGKYNNAIKTAFRNEAGGGDQMLNPATGEVVSSIDMIGVLRRDAARKLVDFLMDIVRE